MLEKGQGQSCQPAMSSEPDSTYEVEWMAFVVHVVYGQLYPLILARFFEPRHMDLKLAGAGFIPQGSIQSQKGFSLGFVAHPRCVVHHS